MRNAGLEEAQAGIKIAGRNINNLRYADDTTLMAEIEKELKSLLMKVKEENEKVFRGSKITADGDCSHEIKRHLLLGRKVMSIKSVMPSNHLILCRPLLLSPSTFPSIRVFFKESVLSIR